MTYNKALKTLERKKNGFIVPISVMESPVYSAEDFINEYFNKVRPIANAVIKGNVVVSYFNLQSMGTPIQYAAVNIDNTSNRLRTEELIHREDYTGEWQWYSFSQLFIKLGCSVKLSFGLDETNKVIRSSTEKSIDLYGL